jgi:hypothetical protein
MGSKPTRKDTNFETDAWSASRRLSNSAGQSGDTQGLFDTDDADSETVEELLEDGQYFEAEAIRAIENVPPADIAEVRTRQFAEDDVPAEYLERDEPPR